MDLYNNINNLIKFKPKNTIENFDMTNMTKVIDKCSVLVSIIVINIIVFSLFCTKCIDKEKIIQSNDFTSLICKNFVHTEFNHLFSNVLALFGLIQIEQDLGSKTFLFFIIFSLISNTIIENIIYKRFKICCGIGFSGIIFSITTWDLFNNKEDFSVYLLLSSIMKVLLPLIKNKNISVVGHLVGIFSGFILYCIWEFANIKSLL